MFHRLRAIRDSILESFWFLPLAMVALSQSGLAALLLHGEGVWEALAPLVPGQAAQDAARQVSASGLSDVLTTVAGGMITLVSIVFSLAFVALTLTSQQLGPRVIDTWLRENATQALLGLSLSAFFAALTGLMALAVQEAPGRAALLGTGFASGLGGLALVAAVVFATRMADAIRADVTVARLGDAFVGAIRQSCFFTEDHPRDAAELRSLAAASGAPLRARRAGYLSAVNLSVLADAAAAEGLRIAVTARENDFLQPGAEAARAVGAHDAAALERAEAAFDRALTLTARRRRTGLPDFEGDSLVEIALRALSPSLNDPFTAAACIDRAAEGCAALIRGGGPARCEMREGVALAVQPGCGADWLIARLFGPLVRAARGQQEAADRAARRLLELRDIARRAAAEAGDGTDAAAVLAAVDEALAALGRGVADLPDEADRRRLETLLGAG